MQMILKMNLRTTESVINCPKLNQLIIAQAPEYTAWN